jgi:hypothetical protein
MLVAERLEGGLEMAEQWQVETEPYVPRIAEVVRVLAAANKELKPFPIAPFPTLPTAEQRIAFALALFARSSLTIVEQLFDNVRLLWSQGRMVGISGMVRFSLEYWGAVVFGKRILTTYTADKNLENAAYKTSRLTYSAKTPVKLPWGGVTEQEAYSVMTFIDKLAAEHPDIRADYDLLSEASHPNLIQNTFFVLASKTYDNFSNEAFKAHAHELLERTIVTMEKVAAGLTPDAFHVHDMAIPLLGDLSQRP